MGLRRFPKGEMSSGEEIKDISGLTHGIGWYAPPQGGCKLTLNVKDGVIKESLIETIGCSGRTHSAAILQGKTILEALNTDLVCDAINVTRLTLDKDNLIIGYEFVNLGKLMKAIRKGADANEALKAAKGHYGRFSTEDGAVKFIDPREE
jgi:NifU-like protein involved in Fe-S cluster formation